MNHARSASGTWHYTCPERVDICAEIQELLTMWAIFPKSVLNWNTEYPRLHKSLVSVDESSEICTAHVILCAEFQDSSTRTKRDLWALSFSFEMGFSRLPTLLWAILLFAMWSVMFPHKGLTIPMIKGYLEHPEYNKLSDA